MVWVLWYFTAVDKPRFADELVEMMGLRVGAVDWGDRGLGNGFGITVLAEGSCG